MILLRRILEPGQSSGCKIERPLHFGPGCSAYATPYCGDYRLTPGYARSEAERAGVEGQSFRFSTTTTTVLPRLAAERCRTAEGPPQPAEDWQVTAAGSEESPVSLCVQRPEALFFWTVHGPFSLGKTQRKWGVQTCRASGNFHAETGAIPPAMAGISRAGTGDLTAE